ncbi:MAG: glutamine-hydrolyzing GMP synthase [Saprospiraceae bacterium]|nr:glutamine-hydrolyzing GMP synthase [Saprospiraceae bacterium]
MHQQVLILDFGSQYTQLIARRIRELNIYCEIKPYHQFELHEQTKAVILSGSPFSVRDANALRVSMSELLGKVPVLAICYGAQLLADSLGGSVIKSDHREYGKARLDILEKDDVFFEGIGDGSQVWMSHADTVQDLPDHFNLLASTSSIRVAAFKSEFYGPPVYAIQFHPEVTHTLEGKPLLENFLYKICGFKGDWTPAVFIDEQINKIRETVGDDQVLMAISGGVDSTVAAALIHKAIGSRLHGFLIDHGLMRLGEIRQVMDLYHQHGFNVKQVDASIAFLNALKGISDPEQKRKIIGKSFIDVFEAEADKLTDIKWLAQGTIYPDVIESVSVHGPAVTIKSHHNVGGLPDQLQLKVLEPLRMLFKDEVRKIGLELGIPTSILNRHPFPGPGLGIRILGEITEEKIGILQKADEIYMAMLKKHNLYDTIWQAGAILLPVRSVGVMGDERTYEYTLALRAVNSMDGMTAEWSRLPYDFLAEVSNEIINKVKGINRVVYDISTKPPATIEWE